MQIALNILVLVGTFFLMEFVAWFAHKYVMHGLLWALHKDHHQREPGFFEKNDSFFLIFAVPSWLLIMTGMEDGDPIRTYMGFGIAVYGFCYFLVHDVFIHRRFNWLKRTDNAYFRAIRKAHKVHHKHLQKEEGECFGMLWVPFKYFRAAMKVSSKSNK